MFQPRGDAFQENRETYQRERVRYAMVKNMEVKKNIKW